MPSSLTQTSCCNFSNPTNTVIVQISQLLTCFKGFGCHPTFSKIYPTFNCPILATQQPHNFSYISVPSKHFWCNNCPGRHLSIGDQDHQILWEASVALDTLLLLEYAASYDTKRKEEHSQSHSYRWVVILYSATTVGAVIPAKVKLLSDVSSLLKVTLKCNAYFQDVNIWCEIM